MKFRSKLGTVAGVFVIAIMMIGSAPLTAYAKTVATTEETTSTNQASAPATPDNFRLVSRDGNLLRLDWGWVAGGVGTLHYELSYAGKTVVIDHYYPGHIQDVSDLDLRPGHAYSFKLWAVDEVGSRSAVPAQLVFETTPPTSPTNLRQLSTRQGYPDLIAFNPSQDASSVRVYEVFVDGRSFGTIAGSNNQFSLFTQVFDSYTSVPVGSVPVQLRAYDSSLNASALSPPLMVFFP